MHVDTLSGVSVVVPVYNGAPLVARLVREIAASLDATGEPYELLLIEDGSRDSSWDAIVAAAARHPEIRGIRLTRNFGQQVAVSAGIAKARRQYVIVMDGDLQNPPSAIRDIVAQLKAGNELVYTVSKTRNNARDAATSRLFWFVLTRVFRVPAVAHQLMMKGMSAKTARAFDSYPELTRTVAGIVADIGGRHAVIEVENAPRREGSSNYGFFRRFDLMVDMIISMAAPLRVLVHAGAAGLLLTLAAALYLLAAALFHSVASDVALLVVAVCLFGSLMTLALGIIGVYLANIYTEVRRRPLFLIAEETPPHG